MHIGYLIQHYLPESGPAPARAAGLSERWCRAGCRVTVHTAMPNRPLGRIYPAYQGKAWSSETIGGVSVRHSWVFADRSGTIVGTLLDNLSFLISGGLDALLARERWDVLIASSPPFFTHIAGAVVCALRARPLVLEVRDLWPDYLVEMKVVPRPVARALLWIERALFRRSAHIVVATEGLRRKVLDKGIPASKVTVITNGVDAAEYYHTKEVAPVDALRRAPGEFIVGYLGNFGRGQDLTVVVRAAAQLASIAPSIRLVMAGDGPDAARVRREALQLNPSNLTILPSVPKEATRAFYNACDACLVPLAPLAVFHDALPSKLFEILACERPVIASLEGEAAALLLDARAGVIAPPGDADALARRILEMSRLSPEIRAAMGERGRTVVVAKYSRDALASQYLQVLQAVTEKYKVR